MLLKLLIKWIRGEKIEWVRTYSYKRVIKISLISVVIASGLSLYIHYETGSTEVSLTLFIFFLACIIGGTIRSLLMEEHTKSRGGVKED
jgi:Na+/proline symporter